MASDAKEYGTYNPVEEEVKNSPHGLIFEMEIMAVDGRAATYEVLKSILKDHQIDLTPIHFSRYCLHPIPDLYVENLLDQLEAKKLSLDKLIDDVNNGVLMQLTRGTPQLNPFLNGILSVCETRAIPAAAITALPDESADALYDRLKLESRGVELCPTVPDEETFPKADNWLTAARILEKDPRCCGVLATDMDSQKSAITSGMRCVAVPDQFTSHQDFGGAECVLDSDNSYSDEDILNLLFPRLALHGNS